MLKRVLIKYIIHQYRVLLEMHDTLSHIIFFLHPINVMYIASDNTLETVDASGGFCLT